MPAPISRYVSELYLDEGSPFLDNDEWHMWRALLTCDDTTLFGFFRPRLGMLAANARASITAGASMLVKLDEANVITFESGWVWLPKYADLQKITRVPGWMKIVRNGASKYIEEGGNAQNRAYLAFCDRFADVIGEREKAEAPPPPEETKKKKPRPAQQTVTAPEFEEVLSFVRDIRTAGGRKHPTPKAKAETIYDWIDKKSDIGWTEDWQSLVRSFVVKDIGEDLGEETDDTEPAEVRLAI